MILRTAGAVLIIAATTGIGLMAAKEAKERLELLRYIKKLMVLLRGEINYLKAPLGEAFYHVGRRASGACREFFCHVSGAVEELNSQSFYDIWCGYIDEDLKLLPLTKKDCILLKRVGEHLGYMDKEMQLGMIDLYVEQLEEEISTAAQTISDKVRIYRCLGVLSGLFAVLVML